MTRSIQIRAGQINPLPQKDEYYQQLVDAIADRRAVQIKYGSLTEWETITTKLRPYQLLFSRRSWYVIGRSSLHREVRIFNIGRIGELKRLREKYTVPQTFSLEKYLGNAWNMIPEPGPDYDIVIRFQPLVAKNVQEVVWHKTQQLEMLEDGSLEFRASVSGLGEVAWWILGYGDQAEVLRPLKLRKLVTRRIQQMHAIYDGTGT